MPLTTGITSIVRWAKINGSAAEYEGGDEPSKVDQEGEGRQSQSRNVSVPHKVEGALQDRVQHIEEEFQDQNSDAGGQHHQNTRTEGTLEVNQDRAHGTQPASLWGLGEFALGIQKCLQNKVWRRSGTDQSDWQVRKRDIVGG